MPLKKFEVFFQKEERCIGSIFVNAINQADAQELARALLPDITNIFVGKVQIVKK